MKHRIVAVFGPCCAGKSTVTKGASLQGYKIFEMSETATFDDGSPIASHSWQDIVKKVPDHYERFGKDYFMAKVIKERKIKSHENIVVCGLRNIEEFQCLQRISKVGLIGLHASYSKRLQRLVSRKGHPPEPHRYLFERDNAERLWGMAHLYESVGYEGVIFTDNLSESSACDELTKYYK